jgi:predicted membrane protein
MLLWEVLKLKDIKKMENKNRFIKYLTAILIIVGGLGLLSKLQERVERKEAVSNNTEETLHVFEIANFLGGNQKKISVEKFGGASINNMMGGVEIDLREATIEQDARIDVAMMMGGVVLKIPKEWDVIFDTTVFLGAVNDKKPVTIKSSAPKLYISGSIMMGAIDIERY